ncbi:MAG: tRNA (adenosine(37)-N6)-threonylcarbamoyltransferase complex transferase subunit TsaD [Oscillospiraceae bacterium]|jgi:N6-L-threonylcarbamoyladenine synthase|nr:tRNA (adenosine(37)-N6)-threonylcarbamoyltransferase complex transferase subunit TsaD [Oscillospiraceae bacterium]
MKILGIETSCDETAAAIVENGRKILSCEMISQASKHQVFGGVLPEVASRCHIENIVGVVNNALCSCSYSLKNIDAIAVTHTPGLIGSLLIGLNFAKGLSFAENLPLITVHHLRSHIAANYLENKSLKPPFLALIVSGGNNHIIEVTSYTNFKIIGKTRDDAAGEAFDKVARSLGLSYPGGVNLDKISKSGDRFRFEFPRPEIKNAPYDYSFSGLKTYFFNKLSALKQKSNDIPVEDLAASFCYSVADYLTTKFLKAAHDLKHKILVVSGGVSANSYLRAKLKKECEKLNYKFYAPSLKLCTDNAAMVAAQGYYEFLSGNRASLDTNAFSNSSIERG